MCVCVYACVCASRTALKLKCVCISIHSACVLLNMYIYIYDDDLNQSSLSRRLTWRCAWKKEPCGPRARFFYWLLSEKAPVVWLHIHLVLDSQLWHQINNRHVSASVQTISRHRTLISAMSPENVWRRHLGSCVIPTLKAKNTSFSAYKRLVSATATDSFN